MDGKEETLEALYSVADVSKRYGVGRATVKGWVEKGRLAPCDVRVGWRNYWTASALVRFEKAEGRRFKKLAPGLLERLGKAQAASGQVQAGKAAEGGQE